jgi:prepilin-type N-terminal cleavage/methylation domain-containing protein
MTKGFTLLETLAAITVLGLVAAAVIPLSLDLGRARLGLDDQLRARSWLLNQGDTGKDDGDRVRAIGEHPGWYLHRITFLRTSAPTPASVRDAPDHRWVHLMVRLGPDPEAPLLADRVLITMPDRQALPTVAP